MARVGNGTSAYMSTPTISEFSVTTKYSYNFRYFNVNAIAGTGRRPLAFTGGASANIDFGFSWDSASASFQKAAYHKTTGGYITAQIAQTMSASTWYWIAVVWTGAAVKVYVDGEEEASTVAADLDRTDLHPALWVFTVQAATGQFDTGTMDQLSVWPQVALTIGEVQSLHAGAHPINVHPSGLLMYCPIRGDDSPERNEAQTSGASAYNLTLTNSPAQVKIWQKTPVVFQGLR